MIRARTALVHDWFQGFHGAERVADALWRGLFDERDRPDIYTFSAARSLLPTDLAGAIVGESRLARLPFVRQRGHTPGRWRYLLPYMPRYFEGLDLESYELVLSSSHANAMHARSAPSAVHVCYCHTPMRYAWLPTLDDHRGSRITRSALRLFRSRLRRIDREAALRPDVFVANSTAVRDRIREFYGRDAVVVHPPVDVDAFDPTVPKDRTRFLWAHRLVSYKRPELVAEAFRGLPYRLTMVGIGPLEQRIRRNLPSNVELLPWVDRPSLVRLFEEAGGFIHVGHEDFGISMVEALAAGTPLIALGTGGTRDIAEDGRHGILLEHATVDAIRRAIVEVAETEWERSELVARARLFSRSRFLDSMAAVVKESLASRR